MFCEKCGKEIPENGTCQCQHAGQPQSNQNVQQQTIQQSYQQNNQNAGQNVGQNQADMGQQSNQNFQAQGQPNQNTQQQMQQGYQQNQAQYGQQQNMQYNQQQNQNQYGQQQYQNQQGQQQQNMQYNQQQNQNQYGQQQYQNQQPGDNRKLFSILSYIGILWLIGLFVQPEKHDKGVKLHVGQGILVSIISIGGSIAAGILTAILGLIFRINYYFITAPAPFVGTIGLLLQLAIWGIGIALMVIGIINAAKNEAKPLPVIGKFAFYK